MRKRRSAKLPSKYVGNMPLDHAPPAAMELIYSVAMLKNIGKKRKRRKRKEARERKRYMQICTNCIGMRSKIATVFKYSIA